MPNHIENIVSFKGSKDDVVEVMNILFDGEGNVTFDGFLPMPEELVGTSSPVRIVSKKDYVLAVKKRGKDIKDGKDVFGGLPMTSKMQSELLSKYGVDNWYDWACNNWGTKWGAYDGNKCNDNTLRFCSAWSTPYPAMVKLSEKFPEVVIKVRFADEDFGSNVGEYELCGGVVTNQNVPDSGSYEAYKMAIDISGGGDWMIDRLFELDADELEDIDTDSFFMVAIEMAYEEDIADADIPKPINEKLLKMAIEDENFEYASELKKIL
jgi:hypothetical protein